MSTHAAHPFWSQELTYLPKVGPARAKALADVLGLHTFEDLLHYFPRGWTDRSQTTTVKQLYSEAAANREVTLKGEVYGFEERRAKKGRKWLTANFDDGTAVMQLVWFKGIPYIKKRYTNGTEVVISGKPSFRNAHVQIVHPEIEKVEAAKDTPTHHQRVLPEYSSTERLKAMHLDSKGIRSLVAVLLDKGASQIQENLPEQLLDEYNLLPRKVALTQIHFPANAKLLERAQARIKFEEFYIFELLLARRRLNEQPKRHAPVFDKIGTYFNRFYDERLPFELTNAQKRVVKEIREDVRRGSQMNRLVQGDVGSGKTIVALMTMLMAIDNGYQAAMMAPTEILAEQHYRSIFEWVEPLGLHIDLIKGGQRKVLRREILNSVAGGTTNIVVGTHALIEPTVKFSKLGLCVIDEQHKFGVLQRAKLWQKHPALYPHTLAMTATPIPRTLAMTVYGDIDVSVIDELPPGRKPIKTAMRRESMRLRVFGFVEEELRKGRQAYVVYPLVDENESLDLAAVKEGYHVINDRFKNFNVSIVHGKLKPEEKDREMLRFKRGETQVLVGTTVIEVGVDVPNASVMVIENAERFGLSQLHQLRGRVGRGAAQSYCILMTKDDLGNTAEERLQAMARSTSGFEISEIDLKIRGPGDFLGTRQSGLPEFRLANIIEDHEILRTARNAAFDTVRADPELAPQTTPIRHYLGEFIVRNQLYELKA